MANKINQILEGWRNHIVPPKKLKELITYVSEERLSICRTCEFFKETKCDKCGCLFPAKTKALSSSCPIDKWKPVTTQEERYEIEKQIAESNN